MAIQDQTIIQFSRSKDIESSREHAILRLDTGVTHHPGQPVVVRYYTDSNRESVNIIYAIGIKDGKGRDCYSIVSLGQNNLIWGISKEAIPTENLTRNEEYLEYSDSFGWRITFLNSNGEKDYKELDSTISYIFRLVTDMSEVVIKDGNLVEISESISEEELENKLDNYLTKDSTDYIKSEEGKGLSSNDFTDELKEGLDKLIESIFPTKVKLNVSLDNTVLEVGNRYNITFTWEVLDIEDNPITSNNIRLKLPNGKYIDLSEKTNYYLEDYTQEIPTVENFTIIVKTNDNIYLRDTVSLEWCSPAYYGCANNEIEFTSDIIKSLNKTNVIRSIEDIGSVEYPRWRGSYIIAFPKHLGTLSSAINENVNYEDIRMFNERESVIIGNILYRVYDIKVYTNSSINYKFS